MGYLGRRIGLSQDSGDSTPDGADGAVGGGILDLFANGYFERQGGIYNAPGVAPPPQGMTASGGVISDYSDGGIIYRAHVFTSSGTFGVTDLGEILENGLADYLVVAGGGSGAPQTSGNLYSGSGGGGAGGLRTSLPGIMPATSSQIPFSVGNHAIVIGGGGASPFAATGNGNPGTNTSLAYNGGTITSNAGGGGGETQQSGLAGGSGGGAGGNNHASSRTGGAANPNSDPTRQGYPGTTLATNDNDGGGGGGGGAGGTTPYGSSPSDHKRRGIVGGAGVQVAIAGPTATTFTAVGAKNPANNQYQYFAGGGGGGGYDGTSTGLGGVGGGGRGEVPPGSSIPEERHGQTGTGGGGGGARGQGPSGGAGAGGSGIVIIRYQIGTIDTAGIKASGGAISFFGGKTIHTFTSSGTFNAPASISNCEYVCAGGGGAGGTRTGGGGGAGGVTTATGITIGSGPWPIVVGAGGAAVNDNSNNPASPGKIGSNTVATFPGGTVTAGYGGAGAGGGDTGPNPFQNAPLGSGGGGAGGTTSSPVVGGTGGPQGMNGFDGSNTGPGYGGGGGGGADPGPFPGPEGKGAPFYGRGAFGVQLPATFRDPKGGIGFPFPSGPHYVAGGGGGGNEFNPSPDAYGAGGGWTDWNTPMMGAGRGGDSQWPGGKVATSAAANSASGGGGGGHDSGNRQGGSGGSGFVIIAYPST